MKTQSAWKDEQVVKSYVQGGRAAFPYSIEQIMVMLNLLHLNEKKIESFIDLGAGDGILSHLILEQFSGAFGYVLDFSAPMLAEAEKRLAEYFGSVELIQGNLNTPDWQQTIFKGKRDKVDAIVSGYCIHHLSHERKFNLYAEVYDRLSENGIFINLEHVSSSSSWGQMLNDEAFVDAIFAYEKKANGERTRAQISDDYHNRADKRTTYCSVRRRKQTG